MSLYPSLEDMKVDKILQQEQQQQQRPTAPHPFQSYPGTNRNQPPQQHYAQQATHPLYPSMNDYMGLDLTSTELEIIRNQELQLRTLQSAQQNKKKIAIYSNNKQLIAPLSGNSVGLSRSLITHGIREVTLCKGKDNKIGMRCKSINNGMFIVLVTENSPASLAGLRFGDQLLQVNDQFVAGMTHEKLHSIIKKLDGNKITLVVRDRPMERTVTLHKDSGNEAGFILNNGKITTIVANSSATRNGLLTNHHILEVNGQNCVGLPDKQIREMIRNSENALTITIIPSVIYEKMMQSMANSLIKKLMDHSLMDY